PTAFIPNEDQGYLIVDIPAPPEASANRTIDVIKQVEDALLADEAVDRVFTIQGFSFSGAGQNAGLAFVTLKDWSVRGPENSAQAIAARANAKLWQIRDGVTVAVAPPPGPVPGTRRGVH